MTALLKVIMLPTSFYQLSQLNIDLMSQTRPLFGINYVILTDDTDFREELENIRSVLYE